MKAVKVIPVLVLIIMINGCTDKSQNTTEILKDRQQREEIMMAISNDHEMMEEMIGHMMKSDHAMQMMEVHQGMMEKMMGNHQMMINMMEKDTVMAKMMMRNMMGLIEKDSTMSNMMDKIRQMGKSGEMMQHNCQ
ncbi:MAG: hypothetical protein R2814_14865 [Flavobacteriaceae bacterium]